MSEVIYARVPGPLKEAAEAHARTRGVTLTTAVADLLERGLEALTNAASVEQLEARATALSGELAEARQQLGEAQLRMEGLEQRERSLVAAYRALGDRMGQAVGKCQSCKKAVSGYDLFVTGRCANCEKGVASLLASSVDKGSGLDQREYMLLVGAVGVLLGMAIISGKG